MESACYIHPTRPAHWKCPKCNQTYCSDCVIKHDAGPMAGNRIMRMCPKCTVETSWIGSSDIIKPFWERLPKFFTYPLSLGPMIYMAFLALGALVTWSWIVQLVCWALVLNYSYAALRQTAQGRLVPPPLWDDTATKNLGQVLKQLVLYIILLVVSFAILTKFGPIIGMLFVLLTLFLLPSMIIILVNTQSLLTTLSPNAFLAIPFKIGKGYFIMFVFLTLLLFAPYSLLIWVSPGIPPYLYKYVLGFAENYYTLISYHLMGYVLLQYHDRIGYEIGIDDIKDSDAPRKEKADNAETLALKRVEMLCREGKFDDAIAHIKKWQSGGGAFNPELSKRYFDLLKSRQMTTEMVKHANTYLGFAVDQGKKNEALDAYNICIAEDPKITFDPKVMFKLGEWLADTGHPKDAIKILSRLTKTFPDDPQVPMSYFRAAQIYNDRLMDLASAEKILKILIKKFPEHDMAPKFQNYQAHISGG